MAGSLTLTKVPSEGNDYQIDGEGTLFIEIGPVTLKIDVGDHLVHVESTVTGFTDEPWEYTDPYLVESISANYTEFQEALDSRTAYEMG